MDFERAFSGFALAVLVPATVIGTVLIAIHGG
mgnify:CR=1 FL=1